MKKINAKFIEKITNLELIEINKAELEAIIDWQDNNIPKDLVKKQAKAVINNFIDYLLEHPKEEQKARKKLQKQVEKLIAIL